MLLGLVLIGILVFAIVDSFTNKYVAAVLGHFMEWVKEHPFQGALAVVLVYIVATGTYVIDFVLWIAILMSSGQDVSPC
jgi:hypothetical protein